MNPGASSEPGEPRRFARLVRVLIVAVAVAGAAALTGCYGVDYRFIQATESGDPIAQRCGPMPFYVNPHGATSRAQLGAVIDAARRLEQVTGVDWQFRGFTGQRISTGFDPRARGGRVLIEFTTFSAPGAPVGYGHAKPNGAGDRYLGGYVLLWPSRVAAMPTQRFQAVVEHELGHVWGLDHASAPPDRALMNAAPPRRSTYGPGGIAGLRLLTRACLSGT